MKLIIFVICSFLISCSGVQQIPERPKGPTVQLPPDYTYIVPRR